MSRRIRIARWLFVIIATVVALDATAQDHDAHASHAQHAQAADGSAVSASDATDHAGMRHGSSPPPQDAPRTPIPEPTAEERAAAFPDTAPHSMDDDRIVGFVRIDHLETWDADPGAGTAWRAQGWIGTDLDRLWLRSEGERIDGDTEAADVELLYGRSVSPWWDVVAGLRHELAPDPSRTWAAFGVHGLAPYKFEIEATAYLGENGRTAARVEAEYEWLLTNRLILQPQVEFEFAGRSDARRGIGAGLTTAEAGLRLRYEVTRRFAPYVGVVHERAFGATARLRRATDEHERDTRLVAGVRFWF